MRIVVLSENTPGDRGCASEHGLSLYVETDRHRLLMDAGASDIFADNAALLGIDLGSVDAAFLSHGHYDHAGGLTRFASLNRHAPIYLQAGAFGSFYHGELYIGMSEAAKHLPQLRPISGDLRLDDELSLFTGVTGRRLHPRGNRELTVERHGRQEPDDFSHEQYLVVTEGTRRVLLSGCAHNGILNILDRFHTLFGGMPDAVVSGFHMKKRSPFSEEELADIQDTAWELSRHRTIYFTGHCTGDAAFQVMHRILGVKLRQLHSGMEIKL